MVDNARISADGSSCSLMVLSSESASHFLASVASPSCVRIASSISLAVESKGIDETTIVSVQPVDESQCSCELPLVASLLGLEVFTQVARQHRLDGQGEVQFRRDEEGNNEAMVVLSNLLFDFIAELILRFDRDFAAG